jgi:hypothetical protein
MTSFGDISGLVERGESLRADVHNFAERLSAASRVAIEATNPLLAGTEVGEEWPLTFDLTIEQRLAEMVIPSPRYVGEAAAVKEKPTSARTEMFMEDKIRNDALEEAYGTEAPRQAFALDVMGWASRMEQADWPILVRMSVLDRGRVEVGVYEDNADTRAYLSALTDASRLTEGDIAEGAQPYAYLGERVVVDDPSFASEVLAPQK